MIGRPPAIASGRLPLGRAAGAGGGENRWSIRVLDRRA